MVFALLLPTQCPIPAVPLPDINATLTSGSRIKLGRFSSRIWTVLYGWYSWGGNRKTCGWYLVSEPGHQIKPLQDADLDDIYLIEH